MVLNLRAIDDAATPRDGYWMATYTGKRIYINNPRVDDFCIEDIAHGLSNASRYSGQCISFYSVAEHCVRGSRRARETIRDVQGQFAEVELAYEFLLHDGAEAYLGDMVNPLKKYMPDYVGIESAMQEKINQRFGVRLTMSPACELLDKRMLVSEAPFMFPRTEDKWWTDPIYPAPFKDEFVRAPVQDGKETPPVAPPIDNQFWTPRYAERMFLERFEELRATLDMDS